MPGLMPVLGHFGLSPSPGQALDHCFAFALPRAARPSPTLPPPSAAILRTLTTMVAHFLGAFPPLCRTDVVAAVKTGVNIRLDKTVAASSCAFSSVGRIAEWEWRHDLFVWRLVSFLF